MIGFKSTISAGFEDEDGVAVLGEVEEGEHVQIVVEGGCEILADDALPLALSRSEVRLVGSQVLHQFETDVLLEHGLRLLEFLLDELVGF